MSNSAKKKERQRLKRQQKRRSLQRANSGSPYRRIGTLGKVEACYLNRNWHDSGQASIYCLCTAPGGGCALAAFLVDLWCTGLKDAWGRLDTSSAEFKESILERSPTDLELVRVDVELVKRLVAGGVRFAQQNGFRLPKRYERWVAVLGDVGDIESADLSDFGVEGGLRYTGTLQDLSRRLIGSTPEQFLARDDVKYILGPDDFSFLDDDELEVDEAFDSMKERGLDAVRQWCFANGLQPHPRLPEAWDVTFEAILQTPTVGDDEELTDEQSEAATDNLERILAFEAPESQQELSEALMQLQAFMSQFDNPDDLFESLGLDDSL